MNAADPTNVDEAIANPFDPELPWIPCEAFGPEFYDDAPVRFQYTKELSVPPARLFEIFEDAASWPKWAPGIGRVIWTSPAPYGVGTTRTVVFWGGTRVYETFTAWEPGREMAFQFNATTEAIWSRFGERYQVEDLGGGRCKLTWTVAYEPAPGSGFARAHPYIQRIMRFNLGTYMFWLGRYCNKHG